MTRSVIMIKTSQSQKASSRVHPAVSASQRPLGISLSHGIFSLNSAAAFSSVLAEIKARTAYWYSFSVTTFYFSLYLLGCYGACTLVQICKVLITKPTIGLASIFNKYRGQTYGGLRYLHLANLHKCTITIMHVASQGIFPCGWDG